MGMKRETLYQRRWVSKNRATWNQYQRERYRRLHPKDGALSQKFGLIDKRVSQMGIKKLEEEASGVSI